MEPDRQKFLAYLAGQGLKSTRQRDIIFDAFRSDGSHVSTEDLYLKIRRDHPGIGYATVHRTLKLFTECGLAEERHFGDGQVRYEWVAGKEHHDHLVCVRCGAVSEFEDEDIEALQQRIARRYGFTMTSHRHELYGVCSSCGGED
ncbi:MAG: transcriptional repressor [Deltaproteobacteria bacterium]|nr:MAG: transcriptional repressor [Deltaproteobacteria bacterium]